MTPEESFDCYCRAAECRWRISPGDAERLAEGWAEQVQAGLIRIGEVDQPLLHLLQDACLQRACVDHGVPYQLPLRRLF
jgi:hypothetical protein